MKWNCDLIQDLLPLYEEGLSSDASRAAVEEHLRECDCCRRLSKPLPIETPEESPAAEKAVTRSIKTVKRRWLCSLIAALLVIPLLLMGFNQVRGTGLCFTNPDDILTARRFLAALERRNWNTAAKLHDYSGDYQNIIEALSLSVEHWAPAFTPITIEGEAYAIKTWLARDYAVPETAADLYGFLYNRLGLAMVSPALWEQVCAVEPGAVTDLDERKQELNGEWYAAVDTPWGEYITSSDRKVATAAEYCHYFDLIPASVWEEAKEDLAAEARALYDSTHAAYDYVAEMTEAEFIEHMEKSYAADLLSLEDLISFDCTGFRGAYRSGDGWHIQYGVTLSYQERSLETTIAVDVERGRVTIASIASPQRADWLDELDKALYPSAHPDY